MNIIQKIEQNTFNHFKYLPELIGCDILKSNGVTIINSGFTTSMFNIVCGTGFKRGEPR